MGFKSKVNSKSTLHHLIKRLKRVDGASAEAGYYDDPHKGDDGKASGLNMATLASYHEYEERGQSHIPRRPFMSQAFIYSIVDDSTSVDFVRDVIYRGVHPSKCLRKVSLKLQENIAKAILDQEFEPLSPITVRIKRKKGYPLPTAILIATGQLIGKSKAKISLPAASSQTVT